jgi:hypothetical protein
MAQVTIRIDSDLIEQAAKALGLEHVADTNGARAAAVLREVAGTRPRLAAAGGGAAPKRAGRVWEASIITYANTEYGMRWDKGPLRGARDLLDVTGCLPAGWLVGAKAKERGTTGGYRLTDAMDQAARALDNVPKVARSLGFAAPDVADVIPWQVFQRPGSPVGRAYAVTEFDHMLRICQMRYDWDQERKA